MSFSVICGACRAQLKFPSGCTQTKARCPKCDAGIDLSAALEASAYLPTLAKPLPAGTAPEHEPEPSPAASTTTGAVTEREEDPLPYPDPKPQAKPRPKPPPLPARKLPEVLSLDDDAPLS